MSILIIGANGGVGSKLVDQLKDDNVDFTAGVRKDEQVKALEDKGIKALNIDVEKESIEELKNKFQSFDKVLFLSGFWW